MTVTHVVGIDPGLVHTGVVRFVFLPKKKTILVEHEAVTGQDHTAQAKAWLSKTLHLTVHGAGMVPGLTVFIEKYQPRSNFSTDPKMSELLTLLRQALPGSQVLLNTGVKKVIRKPLMELLGVWKFSTVTNHQDLRSAARIALYGMSKDEHMNRLLSDVVRDHLAGESWDVRH